MIYDKLKVTIDDNVATLRLNDPATLNAAGAEVVADLAAAIERIHSGELACRAVILTGEGRGFCSGANLSGRNAPGTVSGDGGERLETIFNPLLRRIRDLPVPIVTAVNGPAAGIGCSLALMGDIIICGESGYFLQAFRRIGLVPDGGSTWMLPRMIGKARAMEMMLMGDKITSHTAFQWGLVNSVVADSVLMAEAHDMACRLAKGPASLAMTRKLVWNALSLDYDAALDAERWGQREASATADAQEGVNAFLEKRDAKFTGA
jgi:2-(1,2-epoxy-1,2-dihydrophenyl)acetyl-CoA isomerase